MRTRKVDLMEDRGSLYEVLISPLLSSSRFYMASYPICWLRSQVFHRCEATPMPFHPTHEQRFDVLQEHLRGARTLTSKLMADVMARAWLRLQRSVRMGKQEFFA
jgi:hypothetical protein